MKNKSIYCCSRLVFRVFLSFNLIALPVIFCQRISAQGAIEITATQANTGPAFYPDLGSAFVSVNNGTHQGDIIIRVYESTVETTTASLNASVSPSLYTSITIFPVTEGISVSGNMNMPLIRFNGADHIILDGRVNAAGPLASLAISNTSTGSFASTIEFVNGTDNNKVQYCLISGSSSAASGGIIYFNPASTSSNSDIIINNNQITPTIAGRSLNVIYSEAISGFTNSNITINNNDIFNFLNPGFSSNGIYAGLNSEFWNISGNNFYETDQFLSTGIAEYAVIRVNNITGNGFTISGNYIGGNASGADGYWIKSGNNNPFTAIYLNVGNVANTNSVQGNFIRGFEWSNAQNADWNGIYVANGIVNIGTVTGNIIGSPTGTGSIVVNFGASATTTPPNGFFGIRNESALAVNIENNSIGSVTTQCSNQNFAGNFYGIAKVETDGVMNLTNNLIGSLSEPESIQLNSASLSNIQSAHGIIYFTGGFTGITAIENNTIANISNHTTANLTPGGRVQGIVTQVNRNVILNNSVYGLFTSAGNISGDRNASVIGLVVNCTSPNFNQIVSGNVIHDLGNNSIEPVRVIGLFYTGPTTGNHLVSGNFIHSLNAVTGVNTTFPFIGEIYGIRINNGSTTYANNIINLGEDVSSRCYIYGIYDPGNVSSDNNFYFNTIFIGGNSLSGNNYNTYAFFSNRNNNFRDLKNNILHNERTGEGIHVAMRFEDPVANVQLDYNNYFTATSYIARLSLNNITDFASWKAIVGQDQHSVSDHSAFADGGGISATGYIPANHHSGINVNGITTDYGGNARTCINTMGAWEVTCPVNVSSQPFNVSLCENEDAAFTFLASSSCAFTYLWQVSTDDGSSWVGLNGNPLYTGAETNTLGITGVSPAMNSFRFRCMLLIPDEINPGCINNLFSQEAILSVNPLLTAGVSISLPAGLVCEGAAITITAIPVNGGNAPVYQWYNGTVPVGSNLSSFTYIPANGDIISVLMTSSASLCLTGSPATSNQLNMIVNPLTGAAGPITGPSQFTPGAMNIVYEVLPIANAINYSWIYSGTGVTITGTGPVVTLSFSLSATGGRLTVKGSNTCGEGAASFIDIVPDGKLLYLSYILPEGLYIGVGSLRQASDELGAHFGAGISDQVNVELHDAVNYELIVFALPNVNLAVDGSLSIPVPTAISGSYYVTITHRNHITFTTADPVSFAGSNITYAFNQPSKVYGNNLHQMPDLGYAVYAGDVNQDGAVDIADMTPIDNDAAAFVSGYLPTDVNGDGTVDIADMTFIDNNASTFVQSATP